MANEERLIYANELKLAFKMREMADIDEYGVHIAECFQGHEANLIVDTIPTVDAVEVVHGKWIVENGASIRCSECCFNRASIKIPLNYCPMCGAKMGG